MASHRKPTGSYVRESNDWFAGLCARGAGFMAGSVGTYAGVQLWNNSTTGQFLHIKSMCAVPSADCAIVMSVNKAPSATDLAKCAYIITPNPIADGHIYGANSAGPAGLNTRIFPGAAWQGFLLATEGPIEIVSPNTGLALFTSAPNIDIYVSYSYLVLPTPY